MPDNGKMDVGTRVLKALFVYPADFIKKPDLRQVVVCEDLKYKNKRVGGLTSPTRRTIFLSCESLERSYTFSRMFHHELFHLFDPGINGFLLSDSTWTSLNPAEFKYPGLDSVKVNKGTSLLRRNIPGFVTLYGTASVTEDKAELFSNLICTNAWVEDVLESNDCLALKVQQMKRGIELRCPSMNAPFWKKRRSLTKDWQNTPEILWYIRSRARLGVPVTCFSPDHCIKIGPPAPDSPAELAGLVRGDVIVMVDDKDIGSAMDVRVALLDCEVGQTISLTVDRNGERITKEIKLGKWPDDF